MEQRGFLLVNLGTPDAPRVAEVRRYLAEFLSDPRVLDIGTVARALLLHFVILPRRPYTTARAYQSIWTARGSPLLVHGQDLAEKLQAALGDTHRVELAMRYQSPSIAGALARLRSLAIDRITVFPLFPQFSSAAWGSAVEKVFIEAGKLWNVPWLHVVPPYYDHPAFLEAWVGAAAPRLAEFRPDLVLFSFHGLPERHLRKSDSAPGGHCLRATDCCDGVRAENRHCYRAQCFATSRALALRLGVASGAWEVSFQSRLGRDPWIRPYTDERLRELPREGRRRVAVLSPSFTADCLETLEEIAIRGREEFRAHGGEELLLVPSLNSDPRWVQAIVEIAADSARAALSALPLVQSPSVAGR